MTTKNQQPHTTTPNNADKAKPEHIAAAAATAAADAAAKAQADAKAAEKIASHNARFATDYRNNADNAKYCTEMAAEETNAKNTKEAAAYTARAEDYTKAMHATVMAWYKASLTDEACGKPSENMIIAAVKANALDTKATAALADKTIKAELAAAKKEAADRAASLTLAEITTTQRAKTDAEIVKDAAKTLDKFHSQAQTALTTGQFGPRHSLKAAVMEMKQGTAILAGTAAVIGGDLRTLTGKNASAILASLYAPTK